MFRMLRSGPSQVFSRPPLDRRILVLLACTLFLTRTQTVAMDANAVELRTQTPASRLSKKVDIGGPNPGNVVNSDELFQAGRRLGEGGAGWREDGVRIPSVGNAQPKQGAFYLVLTCVAKREQRYLEEWIEYGRLIGVDHFYIYLNECDIGEPSRGILEPFERRGWVTIIPWCISSFLQIPAYNDAMMRFGNQTTWMGFFDVDEFLTPQGGVISGREPVTTLLPQFEVHGGLYVHWLLFGPNGHIGAPNASSLVAYTSRLRKEKRSSSGVHHSGKSIVRTGTAVFTNSVHFPSFQKPYLRVDTEHREVPKGVYRPRQTTHALLALNHYHSRSRDEYVGKIMRGSAHTPIYYMVRRG